jgi:hypothetical protein
VGKGEGGSPKSRLGSPGRTMEPKETLLQVWHGMDCPAQVQRPEGKNEIEGDYTYISESTKNNT